MIIDIAIRYLQNFVLKVLMKKSKIRQNHQDWDAVFRHAIDLDNQGRFAEALDVYESLFKHFPNHLALLECFGTLLLKMGKFERGLRVYDKSLSIDNTQSHIYSNRGIAFQELKQYRQALSSFEQALTLKPDNVDAYLNRGNLLQELKDFAGAVASYDQAIALKADYAEAYYNRGNALKELKQFSAALESYQNAIALKPNYEEAYSNCGNALKELQRFSEAVSCFDKAIALNSNYTEGYSNKGAVLLELKQYAEALANFDRAISLEPGYAEAHANKGNVLRELGQHSAALACYQRAIALKPDYAEAYSGYGVVLLENWQISEALSCFDKAIAIKPDFAEALLNRGNALQQLKQFMKAVSSYEQAISLKADYAEAYSNLGNALTELKQFSRALECFDRSIALNPDVAEPYWNKSLLLLLLADFQQGWLLYEWRFQRDKSKNTLRNYAQPRYFDQDLKHRSILLYTEQGFGDTIQFCRYAKLLTNSETKVILEVRPALVSLISTLHPEIKVISSDAEISDFDYQSPLLSLPYVFNTGLDNIPAESAYLGVDAGNIRDWQERLGEKSIPRIGLVWSGSLENLQLKDRSIPLEMLIAILDLPFEFHCLQKEIWDRDSLLLAQQSKLSCHFDLLEDFSDTAALIEHMDLVITIDTSLAHLAGALGKPTWILLKYIPDFRWLLDRTDSPWYSSVRLFRQDETRNWQTVIAEVRQNLRSYFGNEH